MFVKESCITLDNYLTKSDLEFVLKSKSSLNHNQPIHFNLSNISFIDVNTLIFLLEIFRYFYRKNLKTELTLPKNEKALKYLVSRNFLNFVMNYTLMRTDFDTIDYIKSRGVVTNPDSIFLNITKIEKSNDIHNILSTIRSKLQKIMRKDLLYDEQNVERFLVAVSEVCQNVVEHSEDYGFIAVEKYSGNYSNKNFAVLKIAVSDGGIGIDGSLKNKFTNKNFSLLEKLKAVFFEGLSRFDDIGRGHGIPQLRNLTKMWHGFIRIRSSFASITGSYQNHTIKEYASDRLNEFTGVQVDIELPEKMLWIH